MTAALVLEDVGLRIGTRRVVDGVSLAVPGARWTSLVGPNGAGKSSLLSLMAGVLAPDRGRVLCDGRDLAQWPAHDRARRIAWLAQAGEADGEIAVRDVALLGRLPHHGLLGAPNERDFAVAAAAMAECEVESFADRRLSALSGGERQRALIARALAVEAPLLLLDEPTAHLDAPHQRRLARALRQRVEAGVAVVTVLHDLTLALLCDHVLVMTDGRLVAQGAPHDAALRAALEAAFDHAFEIREQTGTGPRWLAVPMF